MCGFIAQLVEHRTGIRGGHGFESHWSPDFFFQASSFQLLKLENLLRWSFFTFIYNPSSNMNYFTYTSHHFTPHRKIWTHLIDLAPNVWLHGSVGRERRTGIRGGHGFESRWSPDFFSQASSFQLLKIYCDDYSSLSSTTAVQIWIISYTLHIVDIFVRCISISLGIPGLDQKVSLKRRSRALFDTDPIKTLKQGFSNS